MELAFLDWLQGLRHPILDQIMLLVTSLGNVGILWIALSAILFLNPKTRRCGRLMIGCLLIEAIICNLCIKPVVARIRPYDVRGIQPMIGRQKDFSFPSGHTAAAFSAVAVLFMEKYKKLGSICLIIALMIAFSRMYFYVHYPTDILVGIVIGVLAGVLGTLGMRKGIIMKMKKKDK